MDRNKPQNENGSSSLRSEFERGFAGARNEAGLQALEAGAAATTSLRSTWLHELCPVCSHTFRVRDRVEASADSKIRHATGTAFCGPEAGMQPEFSPEALAFFDGLEAAWPPKAPLVRLDARHPLVAAPRRGMRRNACFFCGHTLRPGDIVVVCPCSPEERLCSAAMHQDILHSLYCYSEWNPGEIRDFCPVTSRSLK